MLEYRRGIEKYNFFLSNGIQCHEEEKVYHVYLGKTKIGFISKDKDLQDWFFYKNTDSDYLCGGSTLKDLVEDDVFMPPDMSAESNENIQNLLDFVNRLSRREKYILIYRYGLNDKDSETLETLARKYGLSRERIRQIQILATEKLKKTSEKHYRKAHSWEMDKNEF